MARRSKKSSSTRQESRDRDVVVVDGSNIATEGRSLPSLTQLNDAVTTFIEENPESAVTVVVDATFGHRIDKKEVKAFDEAVANNELVTPPAGAVGRGDAFVLSIADKVGARILSNDSFQEFHGDYPWLFDEGRLVGGKPVPNIGWVFVDRVPVRGTRSRMSQRAAKTATSSQASTTSRSAATRGVSSRSAASADRAPSGDGADRERAARGREGGDGGADGGKPSQSDAVNELLPFLEFVEKHPIGTSVNAEVESYSSHGAYAKVGDVRGYIPLALMDDPAPTSARKAMAIGEALTLVVASFSPSRRSIDLAYPHMAPDATDGSSEEPTPAEQNAAKKTAKKTTAKKTTAKKTTAKKTTAKKTTATASATKETTKKAAATPASTTKKTSATKKAAPTKDAAPTRRAKKTASSAEESRAETAGPAVAGEEAAPAATTRRTAAKRAATTSTGTKAAPRRTSKRVASTTTSAAGGVSHTEASSTAESGESAATTVADGTKARGTRRTTKKAAPTKSAARKTSATKRPAQKAPAKRASATEASTAAPTARSRRTRKSAAASVEGGDDS